MKNIVNTNILIIDDHPLIVDADINLISNNLKDKEIEFLIAASSNEAVKKIPNFKLFEKEIHYAFVDYNIPEDFDRKILNGVDLTHFIKNNFPNCKIIFITMHNEPTIIGSILNACNPEGLISKTDVSFKIFKEIIETIFNENQLYRSKSILEAENTLFKNNLNWDEYDYQILELISKGEKTNSLPNFVPLSLSAIEKRKSMIKKQLLLQSGNDKDIIIEAKKRGLI